MQYEEDVLAWDTDHLDDFFAWIDAGNDPADFDPQPPVVNEEGDAFSYISRFHFSDRCYIPEAGPPACLIERNVVR